MPRENLALVAFNRGIVSRLGLARADIKRIAMSAEVFRNFMPRVLGSMSIRPGLKFLGNTKSNNATRMVPFIFAVDDTALLEITDFRLRIWKDQALLARLAVSTAITNGTFPTDLTGWTDADEVGATSDWTASGGYPNLWIPAGLMRLTGNGTAFAIRRQSVSVTGTDQGKVHGLRIDVANGPVLLRVGSASGDDDLVNEAVLETGEHHIGFIPLTPTIWVEFKSQLQRRVLIDQCTIEAAGTVELNAPWAAVNLGLIRYDQSGDIVYVACAKTTNRIGYQQWQIQRRNNDGWSIVLYQADDGPFRLDNTSTTTMTASGLTGNVTLTASKPVFRSGHLGALFRLTSVGQRVQVTVTAENTFSDPILIDGADNSRIFTVIRAGLSGTGSTVTLQRSLTSETGPWENVTTYTTDATITFDDALDNQLVYYRIGVATGNYVAGIIILTLAYALGSIDGIGRVTGVTSNTVTDVEVLKAFGGITATAVWGEGEWSEQRGWPTAVAFDSGRLGWSGRARFWDSISDNFYSFDDTVEGDAGTIGRTIGSGPVDNINWMLSLERLILGGEGAEYSVRSSSFDEPLTPSNANLKATSTQGSSQVQAVKVDERGMFVQRGGTRLFELAITQDSPNHLASNLCAIVPEIGKPAIVRMAVQRQPDTRIHCVRSDGTAAVLVFDRVENVVCWVTVDSLGASGLIEDIVILPGAEGTDEDEVYYVVKRTIDGVTKRHLCIWALEEECRGTNGVSRLADSFVAYDGALTTTVTAAHLARERVVIWAGGADIGTEDNLHVSLDGTSGTYVSTPDSPATSIIGDIEVIFYAAADDWTPASIQELLNKSPSAGNRSYQADISTAGLLRWVWSNDGTTQTTVASTTAIPATNAQGIWLKIRHDVDNGASGNDVTFFTSDDEVATPLDSVNWTRLGAVVTNVGVTSIYDSSAQVELGAAGAGTSNQFVGRLYYAAIRSGIEGPIMAVFNPGLAAEGATSVTSNTGETWSTHANAIMTYQRYTLDAAGNVTITPAVSTYVVGLPYTAQFKSAKLVQLQMQMGSPLTKKKVIGGLGLILADVHARGLKYGPDFTRMDPIALVFQGRMVGNNEILADRDDEATTFPGEWSSDSRLCLQAQAPRPCSILAAVMEVESHG